MPRMKIQPKKVRLAVDVPPAVRERLESIACITEADSMSEVVRRALSVYEMLAEEARASGGRTVTIVAESGKDPFKVLLW